ncbi:retropepsin-like aspartic protease [Candidatus Nitronereus thalassa]|uniref:Retropepsin-like aspartic protease n=1 Tax=Candidatus Nitronereus thalassa TaxID=3020898 RepID=A0ABU3KCE2_9BACT|nr:retropepsin-like aspartic protease [Candidatus Nitronereus thalassa]MDT7043937.1 retropepsin-like aspartic protease [Candidatus Nitronereus thalassa]
MQKSSFSGIVIGIAIGISSITAIFGFGLFSIGKQIDNPQTVEIVREAIHDELDRTSLLDMLLGNNTSQNVSEPIFDDEIIIPAVRSGNHLYVDVEINDYQTVTLLVDTGATDIMLKAEVAYELGLSESDAIEATYNTANGPTQQFITMLELVRIGEAEQSKVRASFGRGMTDGFEDGLLGMSFLKHYHVDIDLKREELHLRPREK